MFRLATVAAFFAVSAPFLAVSVTAQVPLPDQPDLYLRLSGSVSSQVVIDGFVDLLCPDCLSEWPTLLQLAAHYTPAQLTIQCVFCASPLRRTDTFLWLICG